VTLCRRDEGATREAPCGGPEPAEHCRLSRSAAPAPDRDLRPCPGSRAGRILVRRTPQRECWRARFRQWEESGVSSWWLPPSGICAAGAVPRHSPHKRLKRSAAGSVHSHASIPCLISRVYPGDSMRGDGGRRRSGRWRSFTKLAGGGWHRSTSASSMARSDTCPVQRTAKPRLEPSRPNSSGLWREAEASP